MLHRVTCFRFVAGNCDESPSGWMDGWSELVSELEGERRCFVLLSVRLPFRYSTVLVKREIAKQKDVGAEVGSALWVIGRSAAQMDAHI